ncbi:MAG TPA: hypothetical protein DCG41_08570 [Verrucomicrobiales bacterium]|nr:hypothetical protein [Verrucomicrobiales bacterium]|tara:strand:+ start:3804 stop:4943 length:1140 start_codon:yes stop_codon:yes gene_type:complete
MVPRPLPSIATKIEVLEQLARTWNDEGLSYSVTNGLQGYPVDIGRDLDICFHENHLQLALKLTVDYLERQGFTVLPYKLAWVYWVVAYRLTADGSIDSIQVDLFDHLQWAFTWIIDGPGDPYEAGSIGPFKADHWSPVAKRLVLNALSQNYRVFEKKPHYLETTQEERETLEVNFKKISGRDFGNLRAAISKRDIQGIKAEIPFFRKAVMRTSLLSWRKLGRRFHSAWLKQWCVNLNPRRTTPILTINGSEVERLKAWTEDLHQYLEKHLVFTCDEVGDAPLNISSLREWLRFVIRHCLRDRRRSALQVLQVYRNHPWENSRISGKPVMGLFLPRPSIVIEFDKFREEEGKEAFQDAVLTCLLGWFSAASGHLLANLRD